MRLALARINPTVGDLAGNLGLIRRAAAQAADAPGGADAILFPELALCGYPPKDLLLHEGFVAGAMDAVRELASDTAPGGPLARAAIIVGAPWQEPGGVSNALLALRGGSIERVYRKRLLPVYDVFDESRYFTPGDAPETLSVGGLRAGLSVCEDLWRGADAGALGRYAREPDPVDDLARAGARVVLNPSASPFVLGKARAHQRILTEHARRLGVAIAAVNQLGGNDDLVFDGAARVYVPDSASPTGARLVAAGEPFVEGIVRCDLPDDLRAWAALPAVPDPLDAWPDERALWCALVLGVRDYCRKTGFSSAVLGLSGGIDSAVTACVAAAALGAENVLGVSLPSRYSSEGSREDAAALARALGVHLAFVPIAGPHQAFEALLGPAFAALGLASHAPGAPDLTDENLQSRLRGVTLMAFSNKTGAILLTTGNKSELAVGYCTLYGDMNGGLAVISDVTKAWVYRLAGWINANPGLCGFKSAPIPASTIAKPPSAELRPGQTDQDSLPPYDAVDEIVERYVEARQSPATIARESGIDAGTVARVVRLIDTSEFKRKQAALGIKVTGVAFGSGRRAPIAQRWRPGL